MRSKLLSLRQLHSLKSCCQKIVHDGAIRAVSGCVISERHLSTQTASTSQSSWAYWAFLALPFAGIAAIPTTKAEYKNGMEKEHHLLPLASRQRIFFKYEKRVRDKSSLDKVFEYFSSQEKDNQKFLTPVDLVRAVVPTYPPSESLADRAGSLDGERSSRSADASLSTAQSTLFQKFDVDGDGLISYPEFLLVLTLLSIREKDVKTIFDVVDADASGYIDHGEFKCVMDQLQTMANVHTARIGRSQKQSLDADTGLFVSLFGKDGTGKVNLPQFRAFVEQLHSEVLKLEFMHYDTAGRGSIAALDFARSLVATADVRAVDRLLDRVDALAPQLENQRVNFQDFSLLRQLHCKLHKLSVALEFLRQVGRPVTRESFSRLVRKLLGLSMSPHVVDILFGVFADDRGILDTATFLDVIERRDIMWARRKPTDFDAHSSGGPQVARAWVCQQLCGSDER